MIIITITIIIIIIIIIIVIIIIIINCATWKQRCKGWSVMMWK